MDTDLDTTSPRIFFDVYVAPSIQLWRDNQNTLHLAVHCIAQIDILAEVVANSMLPADGDRHSRAAEVKAFRRELEAREPVLAVIRDAHDSHKHGQLLRPGEKRVSGERPRPMTKLAFIIGVTPLGSVSRIRPMRLKLVDGSDVAVYGLVSEAEAAWAREMERRGF